MNFYCTTEHCSCMGIKQFSAGKAVRCTAESCKNKSEPSCGSCKWYAEPEGVCVNEMSYDISLCDPVTHKPLKADSTHFIAGGMRAMGGTKELWINVTYNYGHFYYRPEVFGDGGIRSIYGKTGAESIPMLEKAISALGDDVDNSDYWHATEGNAKRALYGLLAFAKMRPDGVWDGD